ncbi:MAG TPA: metalloregulator ArsR/SmtB family transcription factor [Acetobacteraceae bacterium]|jgi:SAM-dependent methyltransferase|nr:metalloregulator ArsR/SmtB family transcription factor [Acetobacteraceae bacterium]
MESLLAALRAAAEPTRLRLLALAARGAFCVTELTEILGQSQPRLSRHLKLLCDAGLLAREREGANAWFALPTGSAGNLARELVGHLPVDDVILEADRRQAARVLAERARAASERFRRQGADWDEMRALDLPAAAVEAALLSLVPQDLSARLLDIGTGTGGVLELLAPRVAQGLGVDASKAMLALARARLARAGLTHCAVRLADMYRLPLTDASFDIAVMQMVLHYAEDPAGVLAEAARVLRPDGRLIVIDLAHHSRDDIATRLAHRWPGFDDLAMADLLAESGLESGTPLTVPGPLDIRIWPAMRRADAPAPRTNAFAA